MKKNILVGFNELFVNYIVLDGLNNEGSGVWGWGWYIMLLI